MALSRDGRTLAVGGQDGTVQLWDLSTGQRLGPAIADDPGPSGTNNHFKQGVYALAFSPAGRLIVVADDATMRTWDPDTRRELGTPTDIGSLPVSSTAFSPDAAILAIGGFDGGVRLWDTATGRPLGAPIPDDTDHSNPAVYTLAFAPNGRTLAVGAADGTLRLWDPSTGRALGAALHDDTPGNFTMGVASVAFSPDSSIVAAGAGDGSVRLWDTGTGTLLRSLPQPAPAADPKSDTKRTVWSLAFNPAGTILAAAAADGTVRLWNPATGMPAGKPISGDGPSNLPVVAFSHGGKTLIIDDGVSLAAGDGSVRLWDPGSGNALSPPLNADTLRATAGPAVSDPTNQVFTLRATDGARRIWDLRLGILITYPKINPRPDLSLGGGTSALAFSPDGKILAVGGGDPTVTLWDPVAGRALAGPIRNSVHKYDGDGGVAAGAFSPDGDTLAVGSVDGTVNLWPARLFTDPYTVLCANVGTLSHQDWNTYAPGEPQPTACTS